MRRRSTHRSTAQRPLLIAASKAQLVATMIEPPEVARVSWSLHRVSLATHDLAAAETFFRAHLGLGKPRRIDERTIAFGQGSRGLRVRQRVRTLTKTGSDLLVEGGSRHVAIEVADLHAIATRLARSAIPHVEAAPGDFDTAAIYTLDPALNVVAFCQQANSAAATTTDIQPWETAWGWGLHHVNLEAADVREAIAFYTGIAGLPEGRWRAPAARGNFSIDPVQLSVLALGDMNRGLHVIRADPGFAFRNNFAHNPSIGGHPAFWVGDVKAVKARLEAGGTLVSDAGVYAMVGMHQIYVQDPTTNMIEVNQVV